MPGLCTGNGIVPLLMYAKGKGVDWTGVELQKPCADLAKRNMELNNVSGHIEIVEGNLCDIPKGKLYISKRDNHIICDPDSAESLNDKSDFKDKFDVVTCNPPYMKVGTGFKNPESAVAIARHEVECDFGDVAKACSHGLKLKGKAFFRTQTKAPYIYSGRFKKGTSGAEENTNGSFICSFTCNTCAD